jgi:hypothetical protein
MKMANKNEEFLAKVGFTESSPKPTPAPTKPAKQYSDNAAYDDYDSPRPKLLKKSDSQF